MGDTGISFKNQAVYEAMVDEGMISCLKQPKVLRRRPKGLEKLHRFTGAVPSDWPIDEEVTCSFPLYLPFKYLRKIGQAVLADEVRGLYAYISSRAREYRKENPEQSSEWGEYGDDYWRSMLKQISAYSYPLIASRGPAYMLLTHLHALTA